MFFHRKTSLLQNFLCFFLGVFFIAGCGVTGSLSISSHFRKGKTENWPAEGGSSSRNAFRRECRNPPLKLIRQINGSAAFTRSLVISDSLIYTATKDSRIHVYDIRNGRTVGRMKFSHPAINGITVQHHDMIIAQAMGKNTLVSYNAYDSKFNFIKPLGPIETNPLVFDDFIYVATENGTLYCLDYKEGTTHWSYSLDKTCHSSPSLFRNSILIGDDQGTLYSFNRFRGTVNWKTTLPSAILHAPVVDSSFVYVATYNGWLVSVEADNGRIRWMRKPEQTDTCLFYAAPAVGHGLVIAGSANGSLYALRISDGKTEWKFTTCGAVSVSPLISGSRVWFGSQDHYLYALDIHKGMEIWKYKTTGRIKTQPAAYGNFLIVAAEDKSLYIFQCNE